MSAISFKQLYPLFLTAWLYPPSNIIPKTVLLRPKLPRKIQYGVRGSECTQWVQILQWFLPVRNLPNPLAHPITCLQLLTFQRLICWPNTGWFLQGSSSPKDTHCQVLGACLQTVLCFGVQGLTFYSRGWQPMFSLVPRNSTWAGIKTREREPRGASDLASLSQSTSLQWLNGWQGSCLPSSILSTGGEAATLPPSSPWAGKVPCFLHPLHWLWCSLLISSVQLYMKDGVCPVNLLPEWLNLWSAWSRSHRTGMWKRKKAIEPALMSLHTLAALDV